MVAYGVSRHQVDNLCDKIFNGEVIPTDERGKHDNHHSLSDQELQDVVDHISQVFPVLTHPSVPKAHVPLLQAQREVVP